MDINDIRSAVTVVGFVLFLGSRALGLGGAAAQRFRRRGEAAVRRRAAGEPR